MASQKKAERSRLAYLGVGGWLREERRRQDRKLREIAAQLDMDTSHLGKIERNERLPPPERAAEYAVAYGVNLTRFKAYLAMAHASALFPNDPDVLAEAGQMLCESAVQAEYGTGNGRSVKK